MPGRQTKTKVQALTQHEQAERLLDAAGTIIVALDEDGCVTLINQTGCRLLGVDAQSLIGKDWFDTFIAPEQRAEIRQVFEQVKAGAAQYHENAIVTEDGCSLEIGWHNAPLTDDQGRVIGTISSGIDITGHRRTELALRESEARLRAVVNTAVDAIIMIDERGVIESVNPATERMFGYAADEMTGRNVSMLMPSPYRERHDQYIRRYLDTGEAKIIGIGREVVGLRKDGTVFPISLAVSELHVGDRRMFTGIVHDITKQRSLERQVLEISTQEQQRIGHDLHDGLGQELTGIAFLTGVLQRKLAARKAPETKDAAEIVRLANASIDHARALVKGLCPVKLEADGFMAAMRELAENIQSLYRVTCRFECEEPVLIFDHNTATQLYYIAHEAVHNAVRHAEPRHIVMGLERSGLSTVLFISDDGRGIRGEDRSSTGRGLHIMRYRAALIGGALDVRQGPGGGTVVSCSFVNIEPETT